MPPDGFLAGLRKLADQHGLLLIFDEVQTGCGRTGRWFAYQHFGVEPDVMTLAKSLCGGIAGGALLTRPAIAPSLRPGMHAATFGGNPIAARAGLAAIEMIERDDLLTSGQKLGELFQKRLAQLKENCHIVRDVRGLGVMIGIELSVDGVKVVSECMQRGLLVNCTHGTVIRLLPALNLSEDLAEEGLDILIDVIREYASNPT
jgi:acetylornithine/succinyldiaminopimelate/putrescine aminotransferase